MSTQKITKDKDAEKNRPGGMYVEKPMGFSGIGGVERSSSNGNNVKHLMWIGAAIAICVSISVFFYSSSHTYTQECHTMIQREVDVLFDHIIKDLGQMQNKLDRSLEKK